MSTLNRQQRRLAKKQERQRQRTTSPLRPILIPDDLKADLAASVRSFKLDHAALDVRIDGTCLFRAVIGLELLRMLEIPVRFTIGGMIYRTGPDLKDVVTFCGKGGMGCLDDADGFTGHSWLICGTDFVDFSVGDWRFAEWERDGRTVQWMVETPEYFWQDRKAVEPRRSQSIIPELGQVYYTGWRGERPITNVDELRGDLPWPSVINHLNKCCAHYGLRERMRG